MKDSVEREIVELHEFFAGWFGGHLPETDAAFARFASVLADSFCIVSPSGTITRRESLLRGIREAHGRRPGLKIEVKNVEVLREYRSWILVTYEEWQREPERPRTGRISSVAFLRRPGTPHGLEWLHVHETWIERS
jgi:hypothetical protein